MIKEEDYNLSLLLLMPLVADEGLTYEHYINKNNIDALIDGYFSDINKPWLDRHLLIAFDCELMDTSEIKEMLKCSNYDAKSSYLIDDKYIRSYALKVPEWFEDEYELIAQNKYTQLSFETKQMILLFWQLTNNSLLYKILFGIHSETVDVQSEMIKEESSFEANTKNTEIIGGMYML